MRKFTMQVRRTTRNDGVVDELSSYFDKLSNWFYNIVSRLTMLTNVNRISIGGLYYSACDEKAKKGVRQGELA